MKYLMIENPGVAPIEGLTLLGASITRDVGNEETIGQFGSGAKHSITLLMRNGLNPIIYCGNLRLEYFTEPVKVKDELHEITVDQVCVRITGKDSNGKQNNRTEKLGWTLGHGVYDWDDISMACREFVSNAIDRTVREYGNYEQVKIELTDKEPRAKTGWKHTRVFIPASSEVVKYYQELPKRFLQFGEPQKLATRVLDKNTDRSLVGSSEGTGNVYKCGVFVRSLDRRSLFDYNFGKEFKLDESRNASDYSVNAHMIISLMMGVDSVREKCLEELVRNGKYYEFENCLFSTVKYTFDYRPEEGETVKKSWKNSWIKLFGPKAVLSRGSQLGTFLEFKGFVPKAIGSSNWYDILKWCGVPSEETVLSHDELKGREIKPATADCEKALDNVWVLLGSFDMLNGKTRPELRVFKTIMQEGSKVFGEYRDGTVYIDDSIAVGYSKKLFKVMLEEVVHHVTQAADHSRDIQDFLFNLITQQNFSEVSHGAALSCVP